MTNAPQPPVQVKWKLILNDGSNAVKILPVNRDVLLIGRALTTDIPLDDVHISRHHARLTRQEEQLIVEDLQTVNGTLVNGESLTESYALQPGDVISLGPFTIRVEQTVTPVPQSQLETSADPVPPAKPEMNWILLIAAGIVGLLLTCLLGLGLYWFAASDNLTVIEAPPGAATLNGPTITINQAPADSRLVSINQPVTVQATASDPSGVTRLELWVDGHKIDEVDTQLVQIPPSLNATLQWLPDTPGVYELEIRAYTPSGQTSIQRVATLRVAGERDTPMPVSSPTPSPAIVALLSTTIPSPTPSQIPTSSLTSTTIPSPTPVPAPPTPSLALLTLNIQALNVRTGPGLQYSQVGQLVQGNPVEIIGQANTGQGKWWQIRFAPAPSGLGWVSAGPNFTTASNADAVPLVDAPALASTPSQSTATLAPATHTPVPTTTVAPSNTVIRAPAGKILLIVSNRSLHNEPALLTLSGGKSVGGGREIKAPPGSDVQIVLEPDFYRALWSSTAGSGGFARGADFTAVQDKVVVMWIVPEEGRTATEMYDELIVGGAAAPTPAGTATPAPVIGGYTAPPGKAIFVAANRSLNNSYAVVTLSGGSFGGGQEIKLNATVEISLELLPGNYRAVWTSPARQGGFSAGREFKVSAGEVILSWIIPEEGQLFMQFPGQAPQQINN